jgi:hypothetical protein
VGQTARLVGPLVEAVGAHVMAAERVDANDTTVPVRDPERGKTKTGAVVLRARRSAVCRQGIPGLFSALFMLTRCPSLLRGTSTADGRLHAKS